MFLSIKVSLKAFAFESQLSGQYLHGAYKVTGELRGDDNLNKSGKNLELKADRKNPLADKSNFALRSFSCWFKVIAVRATLTGDSQNGADLSRIDNTFLL